jgi:hypothetical protein
VTWFILFFFSKRISAMAQLHTLPEPQLYWLIIKHLDDASALMLALTNHRLYGYLVHRLASRGSDGRFANIAFSRGYANLAWMLLKPHSCPAMVALRHDNPGLFELLYCRSGHGCLLYDDRRHPMNLARRVALVAAHYDCPRMFEWALRMSVIRGHGVWKEFCRNFSWVRAVSCAFRAKTHRICDWLTKICVRCELLNAKDPRDCCDAWRKLRLYIYVSAAGHKSV